MHNLFRKTALLLLGLVVVSVADSRAQTDDEEEAALEAGRWALQFQVTQDFTLGSFQGSTISAKKQLSDESALRFGVTPSAAYRTESSEVNGEEEPFSESGNEQFLAANLQWIGYSSLRNEVAFYYGVGPELRFSRQEGTLESEDVGTERSRTSTSLGAGLLGTIGAEWFVRSNISLTAEYRTSLSYLRQVNKTESSGGPGQDVAASNAQDEVRLNADGVLFGLSVYF